MNWKKIAEYFAYSCFNPSSPEKLFLPIVIEALSFWLFQANERQIKCTEAKQGTDKQNLVKEKKPRQAIFQAVL